MWVGWIVAGRPVRDCTGRCCRGPSAGAIAGPIVTARRAELRARGVLDGIIDERERGQQRLHGRPERWTRRVSALRDRVEHPDAMLRHQLGCRRVRCRAKERNALDFALTVTACNIKRSLSLIRRAAWSPAEPGAPWR